MPLRTTEDVAADRAYAILPPSSGKSTMRESLASVGVLTFTDASSLLNDPRARLLPLLPDEIEDLKMISSWLDVPGVDRELARALKDAGVSNPSEYYASPEAQGKLATKVVNGVIPYPPQKPGEVAVDLERVGPGDSASRPSIDWTWRERGGVVEHIQKRPWWKHPDSGGTQDPDDPRWYPDPNLGWEILAYNFGQPDQTANSGDLGYLVTINKYFGVIRLFAYIPSDRAFNTLVCHVSLKYADDFNGPVDHWSFPLVPIPPYLPSQQTAVFTWTDGKPAPGDEAFEVHLSNGNWVRAELPLLYDPSLYSDRMVRLWFEFRGLSEEQIEGRLSGVINSSGRIIPGDASTAAVAAGTILGAGSAGAGAYGAGGPWAAAGGAIVGGFLGYVATTPGEPDTIELSGHLTGTFSADTISSTPQARLFVNLSGTYTPTTEPGYGGFAGYQRCEGVRLGTFGFNIRNRPDPRPSIIPVLVDGCRGRVFLMAGTRELSDDIDESPPLNGYSVPVGALFKAFWADGLIDIVNQRVRLEVAGLGREVASMECPLDVGPYSAMWSLDDPLVLTTDEYQRIEDGAARVFLRWMATIRPRSGWITSYKTLPNFSLIDPPGGLPSHEFDYALDVTGKLRVTARSEQRGRRENIWCVTEQTPVQI